jgi:hypothetical protein
MHNNFRKKENRRKKKVSNTTVNVGLIAKFQLRDIKMHQRLQVIKAIIMCARRTRVHPGRREQIAVIRPPRQQTPATTLAWAQMNQTPSNRATETKDRSSAALIGCGSN